MASIFDKRRHYKPFEYPEVTTFTDSISGTYWTHHELNFSADKREYAALPEYQKKIVEKTLKTISQIEVTVKSFWGDLYDYLPKPEFNGLGASFSDCEWRHSEAYSRLLDIIDCNDFESFCENETMSARCSQLNNWLNPCVNHSSGSSNREFLNKLIVFSILVENVSLFSQFLIIRSFNRHSGIMKDISNVVNWTANDEQVHAQAGIWLSNTIMEDLNYDKDYLRMWLVEMVNESMEVESKILDMIFEEGELSFLKKEDIMNFLRQRIDWSFQDLGLSPMFNIVDLQMPWFYEEVVGNRQTDFFAKRPTEYTKHDKSFSAEDLF